MTTQKITAALKANEVPYTLEEKGFIGIELTARNWSWFKINANKTLTFDHTYSQNTERNKRRATHAKLKVAFITNVIGFNPCK